jgi:hypothetical protein
MGANAVPNYVQIAPGDDAIDQPITAAILKIRFVEAQPHKGPCKEDNVLPKGLLLPDGPIHATRQYSSGKSRVVADRSASVIIQIFSPASVL